MLTFKRLDKTTMVLWAIILSLKCLCYHEGLFGHVKTHTARAMKIGLLYLLILARVSLVSRVMYVICVLSKNTLIGTSDHLEVVVEIIGQVGF